VSVLAIEPTANDANIAKWYYWNQATNTRAQVLAKQRYCAAYPNDDVCNSEVTFYKTPQCSPESYGYVQKQYPMPYSSIARWDYRDCYLANGTHINYPVIRINFPDGFSDDANPVFIFVGQAAKPWEDWPQEKRSIAVASLTDSDWLEFVKEMPVGGVLKPGDKVNAPGGIIIPGRLEDDPNTPEDERLLRKDDGFFKWPGLPNTDFDRDGTPDSADPEPQNPNVPTASSDPPEPAPETSPEPYVNNNPNATPDEVRVGEFLDREAQAGRLPRAERVRGAAETSGTRSGDYRFIESDGSETSADLYQPESGYPGSISRNIIEKGDQAETVVVELGAGNSGQISADEARSMAQSVIDTPDHGFNRVIVIKDGQIIVDYSR